jgi:hypothetical protein
VAQMIDPKNLPANGFPPPVQIECLIADRKSYPLQQALVHGAFADGSGWKRVADILKNDGYKVSVAQLSEGSYADDQKYAKAAIDAMGGAVVLVGHIKSEREMVSCSCDKRSSRPRSWCQSPAQSAPFATKVLPNFQQCEAGERARKTSSTRFGCITTAGARKLRWG